MNLDGPKKQGRFIKKGAKLLDKVALVEFDFQEINSVQVIAKDNLSRSIIHHEYHEQAEVEQVVQEPAKFNQDLIPANQRRPVLMPLDFTKQWKIDSARRARGELSKDEDEYEYQMQLLEQHGREHGESDHGSDDQSQAHSLVSPEGVSDKNEASPEAEEFTPGVVSVEPGGVTKAVPGGGPLLTGREEQWEFMKGVGEGIKSLNNTVTELPSQPPQRPMRTAPDAASEFIPVQHAGGPDGVTDPEFDAMQTYRNRLEDDKKFEQEKVEALEAAKSQGYRDGFRAGEEKGELQLRETAQQVFGNISNLISEFEGLKRHILDNVQDNFYELCQAMAEALIKREFSVNPETFMTVLQRAISEAVEPGKIRVHVHPDLFDKVSALAPQELKESLVKDGEIALGDFKVESNMSVVDVNVSKLISDLLRQADMDLFKKAEHVA